MSQTMFVTRALWMLAATTAASACWTPADRNDGGPDDAGLDDAGQADAGDPDAGNPCDNPAPAPTGACPPGCQFDEVNIETQTSLEAFAAAGHPAPLDTVNIFSPAGQDDPITDAAPLANAVFTARALEFGGPSSVANLSFGGIDVTGLLSFGFPGASSVEFPLITSVSQITIGRSDELTFVSFPSLLQASFVAARQSPQLCDVDLGGVSLADLCDPDLRDGLLTGTCLADALEVTSCCAVPF